MSAWAQRIRGQPGTTALTVIDVGVGGLTASTGHPSAISVGPTHIPVFRGFPQD